MIQRAYLFIKEIFSGAFISLIVFFVILSSVSAAGIFEAVRTGVDSYVAKRFASSIPPGTIRVSPREGKAFLLFQVKDPSVRELDRASVRRMIKLRGVTGVDVLLPADIPMQARISMFGRNYRTDLLGLGVPYSMIRRDLKSPYFRKRWLSGNYDSTMPVILPESILNAYNDGMAGPNGLPRISRKKAVGLSFRLRLGYSSLRSEEDYVETDAVVAGVTSAVNSMALVIPFGAARRYSRMFNRDYKEKYLTAYVRTGSHSALLEVSRLIQKMGFRVEVEKTISRKILSLKRTMSNVFRFLEYLVLALCVIAVSFSTMIATRDRSDYYTVMRVVGSSRFFIVILIMAKYLLIGFTATLCSLLLMRYAGTQVLAFLPSAGISFSFDVAGEVFKRTLAAGMLLPLLSVFPAVFKLYRGVLSAD